MKGGLRAKTLRKIPRSWVKPTKNEGLAPNSLVAQNLLPKAGAESCGVQPLANFFLMTAPKSSHPGARVLTALLLLWLAGTALRLTILAVPPVIPHIHDDLALNATQIGILTGLPSMLFAFAAVPGSLLIARLGVTTAMVVGLALNAIGGALRGALPDLYWLYAMTIAMGAGVAIMQV